VSPIEEIALLLREQNELLRCLISSGRVADVDPAGDEVLRLRRMARQDLEAARARRDSKRAGRGKS